MLQRLTNRIKQGEDAWITFLSVIVPWMVFFIPAYMTYSHAANPEELNFPWYVAIFVGASVECLGVTSLYRTFQFLEFNRKFSDAKKKSPWWIPAAMYLLYLTIVLSVNVIQDIAIHEPVNRVWVVGLLSTLSIPAGVLVAVTAVHNERVLAHQKVLEQNRENRSRNRQNRKTVPEPVLQNPNGSRNGSDGSGVVASRFREQMWGILEREWSRQDGVPVEQRKIPSTAEIAAELNLDRKKSKSYIWGQTNEWKAARGIAQSN